MKQSLNLQVSQHLTMTPQLQQAIRLLQLSTLDLRQEVQAALESNPLLELDEDGDDRPEAEAPDTGDDGEDPIRLLEQLQASGSEEPAPDNQAMDLDSNESMPDELPVDSAWDDIFEGSLPAGPGGSGEDGEYEDAGGSTHESLADRLLWQLNLTPMGDLDRAIAFAIIECLDTDGYLTSPLEDVREAVLADDDMRGLVDDRPLEDGEEPLGLDEIEAVLHLVQSFDPPGVAARNLRECLLIQLRQLPDDSRWRDEARRLVADHLDLLAQRDFTLLGRRLGLREEQLASVIRLIRSLNPRPGGSVAREDTGYVVPDVIVRRDGRRWRVELNPDAAPRLRINTAYSALARSANRRDAEYLRNQEQEARWLIKSLRARNETLLKVAGRIIEIQQGFLDLGPEAMKPLVLADIAEAVGMHESTISRVTTEKYMHTPRGIFELKYFFSSHVGTAGGGECSSTAIRAMIKKLVAAENPRKPLSDNQIADLLVEQGINVARRTIAKYRESLNILSSSERKQLV